MNTKIRAAIIIVAVASLIIIGVVVASYLMTSNEATGTVTPKATLSLVLSPTTILDGESWTLIATVSDGSAGLMVTFNEASLGQVGSSTTDSAGQATLTLSPSAGSYTYTASATHP